jgi:hypothetical protein
LGSGADTQLDEPLPGDPDPLGEEGDQLLGLTQSRPAPISPSSRLAY